MGRAGLHRLDRDFSYEGFVRGLEEEIGKAVAACV